MNAVSLQKAWAFLVVEWWKVVVPLAIFLGCLLAGFIIRRVVFGWLRKWSQRSGHNLDIVIVSTLRGPIMIWALIAGLDLAARSSALQPRYTQPFNTTLEALWLISLTIIAAQLSGNLVRIHSARAVGSAASPTLTKSLTQIVVSILGLMIVLNHLHIDIRPLLTAVGVGGLAVALALQDTLANLFAGFYISVSSQTRVGDYVKLNSGEEGYVSDITWRSTTLRSLNNNFIFIPNSSLAKAIVTNYFLPSRTLSVSVTVHVAYDADVDRVEKLLLEEATQEKIEGMVTDPPPSVSWIPGFGASSLELSLNFQVVEFVNQYGVQSELRKRIFKRLQREGIALPYPAQEVIVKERAKSDPPSGT
jgi:small-conductance mechanosensitive channel